LRSVLTLVLCAACGLALGLWSAYLTVRSPAPVDALAFGPWQAWPNAGTVDVDPYSRARLSRTGEIPLGSGEGLALLAQTDDAGEPLVSSCEYRIAGQTPPARLWTLSVENTDGHVLPERNGIAALGSDVLLRNTDGAFEIALSQNPQPGNWISTQQAGEFRVVVRLYDTAVRANPALTTITMPHIQRGPCA
jgi:hypothetical protein